MRQRSAVRLYQICNSLFVHATAVHVSIEGSRVVQVVVELGGADCL